MTVRSITQETEVSRFLYYFFLCLCKSFKELFLQYSSATFSAKADAKVQSFCETANKRGRKVVILTIILFYTRCI